MEDRRRNPWPSHAQRNNAVATRRDRNACVGPANSLRRMAFFKKCPDRHRACLQLPSVFLYMLRAILLRPTSITSTTSTTSIDFSASFAPFVGFVWRSRSLQHLHAPFSGIVTSDPPRSKYTSYFIGSESRRHVSTPRRRKWSCAEELTVCFMGACCSSIHAKG